jgi:plasmid stabilization system protein ParE
MTDDQGFRLHPGAAQDITEIWEFIAEDNPLAARRVREDIWTRSANLRLFPTMVTSGPISPHGRCGFKRYAITSSLTRPMRSLWL